MRDLFESTADIFYVNGRLHKLLIILFILINFIVTVNAIFHPPWIGYDATHHLLYIKSLSAGHFPSPSDSTEYFSPPLAYLLPAAATRLFSFDVLDSAKLGQLFNVLVSIVSTFLILKICELILPGNRYFKLASLGFLAIIPVYYKTFAFVRGEPFLVLFSLLMTYYSILIFFAKKLTTSNFVALGISIGLVALSRQWGLLTIPAVVGIAVVEIIRCKRNRAKLVYALVISMIFGLMIGGWYYFLLKIRYGSFTTFNMLGMTSFRISNQPASFYIGLGSNQLFAHPFRTSFTNQFFPIMYSETWGDYWGYFVVNGLDTRKNEWLAGPNLANRLLDTPQPKWFQSNYINVAPYLGRVNIVGLFPTLLILAGMLYGLKQAGRYLFKNQEQVISGSITLFLLIIMVSFVGYLWFLIMYPITFKGTTIKTSYILQIFPYISILVGFLFQRILQRSSVAFTVLMVLLSLVFLHNIPVIVTHYNVRTIFFGDLILY